MELGTLPHVDCPNFSLLRGVWEEWRERGERGIFPDGRTDGPVLLRQIPRLAAPKYIRKNCADCRPFLHFHLCSFCGS